MSHKSRNFNKSERDDIAFFMREHGMTRAEAEKCIMDDRGDDNAWDDRYVRDYVDTCINPRDMK